MSRFSEGCIPAFEFTPRENASIHMRVRTWPHGTIKDTFHDLKQAKMLLSIWEENPAAFIMEDIDIEELRLAIEMAEAL